MQLLFSFFATVLSTTVSGRLLRKPTTKKPNFANVLVGINRKIKAGLKAQLTVSEPPAFAADIFGCALTIKQGMEDLRLSYTGVHVSTVIEQACDFSNVYLELGGNKETCSGLLKALEEEQSGEQNYHRWCRKVAASESESMKKALEQIEKDPEAKKQLGQCEKDCPFVAKIIKGGAAVTELMLELFQPPPAGTTFEDMIKKWTELYKKLGTQAGAMCDDHKKMKCTLQNMHGSCTAMFGKVGIPLPTIERLFTACQEMEPCKKTCNGVMEKMQDFEIKHTLSMFTGSSSPEEMMDLCKSYHRVDECTEKPECKPLLNKLEYTKEEMTKRCEVVDDPCYSTIATKCETEANAFFGKESEAWDAMTCTDKFYPWNGPFAEKELKECCGKFGSFGKCAKSLKCEKTLERYMYITPHPNWPEGEIVECSCPSEWEKAFGGKACPQGS